MSHAGVLATVHMRVNLYSVTVHSSYYDQCAIHRLPFQQFLFTFPVSKRTNDSVLRISWERGEFISTGGGQGGRAGRQRRHGFLQYPTLLF